MTLLQANPAAKDIIASTWKNAGFNPNQQPGSDNGIKGTMPSVLAPGAAGDEDISQEAANSAALMTFPMLQDEVYVDEDTLARLFLVTSNMSSVLKVRIDCCCWCRCVMQRVAGVKVSSCVWLLTGPSWTLSDHASLFALMHVQSGPMLATFNSPYCALLLLLLNQTTAKLSTDLAASLPPAHLKGGQLPGQGHQ